MRFEMLLTSKWLKMYAYWKYSTNTQLVMYAKQVMVPYGKPGQIPTKRRPISTEVLMEVARIISHRIGPPRRFLIKGKTIIVWATRTLSIEFRAITPVAMRGNNALPLRRSLSINRNYVCSCLMQRQRRNVRYIFTMITGYKKERT